MPITPQFLAARAAENRRRLISYCPLAEPLALPVGQGRIVRVPQVHLTPRINLELEVLGSPFVVGGAVAPWDVFRLLWRCHPLFLRPDGTLPNRGHRRARSAERIRGAASRLWLACLTGRLLWPLAVVAVRDRIALAWQDDPADSTESRAPAAPQPCEPDELCRYFAGRGLSRDAVLDSPIAVLLQFIRSETLAQPDGELEVIDPSDALLA